MRFSFLLTLFFLAVPAWAQEVAPTSADSLLALPTEWETYYVAFLRPPSGPAPALEPEAHRALMEAHIQYQLRLRESGQAVAAGGVAADSASSLIGITLLRAGSLAEAEGWAQADPAVVAGHFDVEVRAWYVPAGRLPRH